MSRPSFALCALLLVLFELSPVVARAQRGSGHVVSSASSHGGSISQSGGSISSSAGTTSRATANVTDHASVIVVSGRGNRSPAGNSRYGGSGSFGPVRSDPWLRNDSSDGAPNHVNTIGFLEASESARGSNAGPGEEPSDAEAREPQRTSVPAVPVAAPHSPVPRAPERPIVTAPSVPRMPVGTPRPGVIIRPLHSAQNRPALWFLAFRPSPEQFRVRQRHRFHEGFGIGFFGFGLPFAFGFGPDCNPFWAEPWAFGCDTFGYWDGFGGYGAANAEPSSENTVEALQEQGPEQSIFIPPPEGSSPEEIEAEKILFVLFLKNGAVYAVTNYWIEDGKLHYLTSYGGENTIDMNDLDLQKTVDVNAKRGVDFTLKPRSNEDKQKPPQE